MENNCTELWRIFILIKMKSWGKESAARSKLLRVKFDNKNRLIESPSVKYLRKHYFNTLKSFNEEFPILDKSCLEKTR